MAFFRKKPRPPRKWYQKTRYQFPMLIVGLLIIPVWVAGSYASENLKKAPPVGTQYIVSHYNNFGYRFVTSPSGRDIWTRFCIMAKGGTVTLTDHLLFRKDVSAITKLLSLYKSAVFVYQPPRQPIPPLIMGLPWCPSGLQQPVPITHYFPKYRF